jgi:hypothetical protein
MRQLEPYGSCLRDCRAAVRLSGKSGHRVRHDAGWPLRHSWGLLEHTLVIERNCVRIDNRAVLRYSGSRSSRDFHESNYYR